MRPKLRFQEFTDDWKKSTLGELTDFHDSKRVPLESAERKKRKGIYPYYGASGIIDSIDDFIFDGEYILLAEDGANIINRSTPIAFIAKGKFWVNNHAHIFTSHIRQSFIVHLLENIRYDKYNTGTAQPKLNRKVCESINLCLPQNEMEIHKISYLLDCLDRKINLLTKKKEALETYKKGLMQKIFSQELRFKREDGTDYPEWDCQPLGDLAYITSGKSNREDSDTDAKYHFFDRSSDVRRSGIYLFDDDAVIVAGEGQEFIPKKYSGKFDLHQRAYAIMKFGDRLSYEYCYYFIFHHRRYFEKMAVGTTVLSLRLPMFQKMQIQLPSIDEQDKIASVFENLDSYLQKVSYSIQSTELLKKGLLQQMFV